jgi:hypothetical protein
VPLSNRSACDSGIRFGTMANTPDDLILLDSKSRVSLPLPCDRIERIPAKRISSQAGGMVGCTGPRVHRVCAMALTRA